MYSNKLRVVITSATANAVQSTYLEFYLIIDTLEKSINECFVRFNHLIIRDTVYMKMPITLNFTLKMCQPNTLKMYMEVFVIQKHSITGGKEVCKCT